MLRVVAAARAHHAAVALWMLQRKRVGMVQLRQYRRRLWVRVLAQAGPPVMGENLGVRGVRGVRGRDIFLQGTCIS